MNHGQFYVLTRDANQRRMQILLDREKVYSSLEDRLSQFKEISARRSANAAEVLLGMVSKHLNALARMCDDPTAHTYERWCGITDDIANYMTLLEALILDLGVPLMRLEHKPKEEVGDDS